MKDVQTHRFGGTFRNKYVLLLHSIKDGLPKCGGLKGCMEMTW